MAAHEKILIFFVDHFFSFQMLEGKKWSAIDAQNSSDFNILPLDV